MHLQNKYKIYSTYLLYFIQKPSVNVTKYIKIKLIYKLLFLSVQCIIYLIE